MNLPELYTQVVAARPEAAVRGLVWHGHSDRDAHWSRNGALLYDDEAEALIGWHWLSLLPHFVSVMRGMDNPGPRYWVDSPGYAFPCADTPIEAIAAYLLETAKEAT